MKNKKCSYIQIRDETNQIEKKKRKIKDDEYT